MKVIKYWKVQLLQLSQPSSVLSDRKPIESLLFEGYSKDKPNINLGAGLSIELFTAPDTVETRIFRDHLIDGVLCIPVYERDEGDDETDGTQEEQAKPPSREAMIEYIKQAIGEGYQPKTCDELISNHDLIWLLHDKMLDYEYRACWNWRQNHHLSDVNKARRSSFENVVKPVIKWLNENANPHTSVSIDATSAQLLTGEIGIHTEEFIKD
ncbi:hypothetical protein ACV0NV_003497 [Klebsiella pneumoniae]|uniref:hypothetical protein n=1 Tax=Klebsiella pneumoniae TaxID=573 RepID=UPI0003BFC90C|nr:hypothetical protein [Klebsiella pneumoniae]EFD1997024.1 hypothetical protein [Escherichia coli]ELA0049119.1 hypothetical protein [Klebsiella pneumoniae]ELC3568625.1 hypothetical protein [Klebsiella pneumoniae]ESM16045.1 hypothetical protein L415_02520 [Klebsiella pneumoniae UCICRE 4]KMB13961.1 hypothetical protein SL52_02526 [Klebsiella pneumoniae]